MEAMITMSQTEHLETLDTEHNSEHSSYTPDLESATEKQAAIKQEYPAYYKAWRNMYANYGVQAIVEEWRGTTGLIQFIADTSVLPDNPDTFTFAQAPLLPKLKRKREAFMFSPMNVYWKLSTKDKLAQAILSKQIVSSLDSESHSINETVSSMDSIESIESIKQLYPTRESQEERMNTLFTASMNGSLTPTQDAELTVLGSLVAGTEIEPEVTPSKYVDI